MHGVLLTLTLEITPTSLHPIIRFPDWITFFLSQADLCFLTKCTIEPMLLSYHNPIIMILTFPEHAPSTKHWRLDSSLLTDKMQLSQISTCLNAYFQENADPDISLVSIWDAHKCVIRVEIIALAAHRQKEKVLVKINTNTGSNAQTNTSNTNSTGIGFSQEGTTT